MIPAILACAFGAVTLTWDPVLVDINGNPETVVKGEVSLAQGLTVLGSVPSGPTGGEVDNLLSLRSPGIYGLQSRVADAAGNWSAWSAPLPYTVEAPRPTKVVISWQHSGKDLNGQEISLTASEVAIFPAGSGPSGTPVLRVPGSTAGPLGVCELRGLQLVAGEWSAFARVRSAAGWSSYSPPIPFRWPPSEPQPQAPPLKATVPARAIEVKSEVKP